MGRKTTQPMPYLADRLHDVIDLCLAGEEREGEAHKARADGLVSALPQFLLESCGVLWGDAQQL